MKFYKKTDFVIISVILLISLIIWGWYRLFYIDTPVVAAIYYDTKLVDTIELDNNQDSVFSIKQQENVVFRLHKDGSISFEKSDCRDKLCVRSGKLKTVGESAACLPNKISIKIIRKNKYSDHDLDIVIR
jgi:hypothetical protein